MSSSGFREGNAGNDALHVIGLYGPGGKKSLSLPPKDVKRPPSRKRSSPEPGDIMAFAAS